MKKENRARGKEWQVAGATCLAALVTVAALLVCRPQTEPQEPATDPNLIGVEIGQLAGGETDRDAQTEHPEAAEKEEHPKGTEKAEHPEVAEKAEKPEGGGKEETDAAGKEEVSDGEKPLPDGLLEELEHALNGTGAEGLISYMKASYPGWYRQDTSLTDQRQYELVEYFAGDTYETKNLWGSSDRTAKVTYNYIWEGSSRFQDRHQGKDPDLIAQRARVRAMLQYLLPAFGEAVYQDFLQVEALNYQDRRWYSRTAWYGERLVQISIQSGTVTVTVYPLGYTDEINGLPAKGQVEELFGDEGL